MNSISIYQYIYIASPTERSVGSAMRPRHRENCNFVPSMVLRSLKTIQLYGRSYLYMRVRSDYTRLVAAFFQPVHHHSGVLFVVHNLIGPFSNE